MGTPEKAQKRWRWTFRMEYVKGCTYESRHNDTPIRDPFRGRRHSKKGIVYRYALVMAAGIPSTEVLETRIMKARKGRFSEAKIERISRACDRKFFRYEAVESARVKRSCKSKRKKKALP